MSSVSITKVTYYFPECGRRCDVADVGLTGRNRGLLELDLKLDDLLEMQKDNLEALDLEYVQFNVTKVLALLNKRFARKKGW